MRKPYVGGEKAGCGGRASLHLVTDTAVCEGDLSKHAHP